MKMIPNRTFLLRQIDAEDGGKKDVIARKGVPIDVTADEAKRLANDLAPLSPAPASKKK